jgi:tRNA threonylcarbamoyladenosine biosynthesis protein TsaB
MRVIILGIDTATPQIGCALGGPDGPLASFHAARGRRHAETLAPAVAFVCEQAGVALSEIDAIAVDVGPGLFTGLRVGLATGKAMAGALAVPMVGVTSLDLLARPLGQVARPVVAMVDARRGEVFWALYRPSRAGVERLGGYAVDEPAVVVARLAALGGEWLAVGDGAQRYAAVLGDIEGVEVAGPGFAYPSAAWLVELAWPLAEAGKSVAPQELAPLYLRTADVRINWQQRPTGVPAAGPAPAVAGEAR